jgi:hypothetical protein
MDKLDFKYITDIGWRLISKGNSGAQATFTKNNYIMSVALFHNYDTAIHIILVDPVKEDHMAAPEFFQIQMSVTPAQFALLDSLL